MRKLLGYTLLAIAVIAVGTFALSAPGPALSNLRYVSNVSDYAINDENPLILIKYVGTEESGTIDINTNALELHIGDVTSEAAATNEAAGDVNVGDVCGATASALDVTDGDCDTFGELVDVINATTSDSGWVAVLVGALASESIGGATDFIDPADKLCKQVGGCVLYPDSSVHDELPILFAPWINKAFDGVTAGLEGKHSIEPFLTRGTGGGQGQSLKGNPIPKNYVPVLDFWFANMNAAGAGTFQIYSLDFGSGLNSAINPDGTAVERLLYTVTLADDTELTSSVNRMIAPLYGDPGTILLIRGNMSASGTHTDTDDEIQFNGYYVQKTP